MQKVKPLELHRVNHKACPNFKYFDHRCEEKICDRHQKLKLAKGGDDSHYEGDVDTGGEETSKDAIVEESGRRDDILDDIYYEDQSRKRVLEWFERNENLERMNGGWV